MKRSYFIGIAGGSCSGKTTLAGELARRLGNDQTARISIDCYYRGPNSPSPEAIIDYNFDEPSALDHDLLVTHVRELRAGRSVDVPVYDFKKHRRTERTTRIRPVPFVIVEGLFPLYWDDVRGYLATKVFIDASHATCLARRLERDNRERGRSRTEVTRRYNEMARPMFEMYVRPTRRFADIVVPGDRPVTEFAGAIVDHIVRTAG